MESFMPYEVRRFQNKYGRIELNFFLEDTQSIILQQAINVFVSSREPYSVTIFTTSDKQPTYYNLNGNIIECPHDFILINMKNFIKENVDNELIKE